MPRIGDIIPRYRCSEAIGKHDEREFGNQCQFNLTLSHFAYLVVRDVRAKKSEFESSRAKRKLAPLGPRSPSPVEELTDPIDRNKRLPRQRASMTCIGPEFLLDAF